MYTVYTIEHVCMSTYMLYIVYSILIITAYYINIQINVYVIYN